MYLAPGLLARLERSRGEGDHPPALIGDREHDPLAKPVVDRALRAVSLFFRAEQAAGPQRLFVRHAA